MSQAHTKEGYYPTWLTDEECGNEYKRKFAELYEEYYNTTDKKEKKEKLKELKIYLTITCDVIAYRYLVKYYSNLFHKLNITVEEYMDYKVERIYVTIRDKKEHINDILSYVYMSFMLSSSRLIYDYAESLGRCKLVKVNLPYFQIQRLKFFFISRDKSAEHIVYNVDNLELDKDSELIHSNIDRYSLSEYNRNKTIQDSGSNFEKVRMYVEKLDFKYDNSKNYLINIFDNWQNDLEGDFEYVKQNYAGINSCFNLVDYIKYKYENHMTDLSYDEYIDVLSVLNKLMKLNRRVTENDKSSDSL